MPRPQSRRKASAPHQPAQAGASKSLQKAIRILFRLAENGPELGITQLAKELRLDKATVHRLLNTLQKFELVEQDPVNAKYRLGLKFHELSSLSVLSRSLQQEAHPFLLELARRSGECVNLAVPGAGGVICLDRVDSPHTILTVRTLIGERFPAHASAVGKVLLAWLPPTQAYAILFRFGMRRYTPLTVLRTADFKNVLDLTRRQGYAIEHSELEKGLSSIAAPVLYKGDRIIAALGMAGPTLRMLGPDLEKKMPLIIDFAARLSKRLSLGPPNFGTVMEPLDGTSLAERLKSWWKGPIARITSAAF